MPLLDIRKILPDANLDRLTGTLDSLPGGSRLTQAGGLARLSALDERDFLEDEAAREEESKRKTLIRTMQKERVDRVLLKNEDAQTSQERRQFIAEFILNAKAINQSTPGTFTPDDIAQTVTTMAKRPLKTAPETKAEEDARKLVTAKAEEARKADAGRLKTLFDKASPKNQQAFLESKDPAVLVPAPEKAEEPNFTEDVNGVKRFTTGLKAGERLFPDVVKEEKKPTATELKETRLDEAKIKAESLEVELLDDRDNLTLKVKAARARTDADPDRVQGRRQRKELDESTVAFEKFNQLGGDVLKIIRNSKTRDSGTIAGAGAKAVRSFSDTLSGLAALIPGHKVDFDLRRSKYETQLNDLARGNDELASLYYGIAYLNIIANGLSGTRVTNQGFERALIEAKGSAGSPGAIENKMNVIRDRLSGKLDAQTNVILGGDHLQLDREFPTPEQPLPSNTEAYKRILRRMQAEKEAQG